MQINGNVIENRMVLTPTRGWEAAKGWVQTHPTKEAMSDATLKLATFGSTAFLLSNLQRIVAH
jgi:hypothetical protein